MMQLMNKTKLLEVETYDAAETAADNSLPQFVSTEATDEALPANVPELELLGPYIDQEKLRVLADGDADYRIT